MERRPQNITKVPTKTGTMAKTNRKCITTTAYQAKDKVIQELKKREEYTQGLL